MNIRTSLMAALMVAVGGSGWAQQPPEDMPQGGGPQGSMQMQGGGPMQGGGQMPGGGPRQGGGPQGDPMMENFFPPELIMQNQKAVGLKEDQQKAIRQEMTKSLEQFTDLQWQQSAATENLMALLKQEQVDEKQALSELDKQLNIENQIKHMQLEMLIKVKNLLTQEQQQKLRQIKQASMQRPGMMGRMGMNQGGPGMGVRMQPGAGQGGAGQGAGQGGGGGNQPNLQRPASE